LKKIYIGKAIDNTKLFVVDQNNQLLPLNFPGELIITGVNLARGYMNQPELSNEKFFDVELPGGEVLRAYHTGDQAKLSSNGEIEYLGRMDNQVKIRGLRIELGEIESKILDLPKIAKCIVTADELNRQKTLVAYLVLKKNERLNGTEIKEELRKILPDYMIPSFFIFLDEIPLTTSGKPDRKRLPRAELSGIGENYVPASNNIEKILVGIWKETLGLDNVSVSDNFFDMGGNSLLAISLSQKISKQLERPVSTLNLLEYTTIRDLSQFLTSESDGNLQNRKWENPTDTYRRLGSENLRNRRRMN
jgi:acyl carrier protein